MKKIIFLFAIISFVSCNDMESDIDKACELTTELMTETIEKMPEAIELGMKAAFGTDEEKEAAKKKLEEIEKKGEEISEMLAAIKLKYDEDEFTAALFEKCEAAQKLKEMGEAFEDLGDL